MLPDAAVAATENMEFRARMRLPGTGTRQLFTFVALGVALFVAIFVVAETGQERLRETTRLISQSQERQLLLSQYLQLLLEAETALRGFLLTNDDSYLEQFDRPIAELNILFDRISASYADAGLS